MEKREREKLTELIEAESGNNWWNPEEFEKHVRRHLPTDLQIVGTPPAYSGNYNCFVFAFGLEGDEDFLGGKNPIQQEFVKYLLVKDILEITEIPEVGNLLFYVDEHGNITHGGILRSSDQVLSKWMWGCLLTHKVWDVPSSFGDSVFYTKTVSSQIIKDTYKSYKKSGEVIEKIG